MPTYTKYYYTKPPEQKPGATYTKYSYTKKPQAQPVVEQKKPIYTQPKPSYKPPVYQPPVYKAPKYEPPKKTYIKSIQTDNKYKPKPQPKPKPKPICKPECDIEIIGPSSGEAPFTARFSGSGSSDRDGRVTQLLWDFGDGRTGSGENVSHRYNDPGNYTVTLRVRDNDGYYSDNTCKTKITVTEKENEEPECIIARASPQRGDAPLRVRFEGDGRDDTTDDFDLRYFWDFDDGETSTSRNPTHTFDDDDRAFRVRLEVEDGDGKRSSNRCEVTIRTNEEEEDDDLVCEFDLDKDVKDDEVKVKVDARDSEGNIDKYEWDFDDDNDDDEEDGVEADHTYDEDDEGSHTIRLTITGENGDEEKCSRRIDIDIEEKETKIVKIIKTVEAKEEGEVKGVSAPKTGSNGLMIGLVLFMVGLMLKSFLLKIEAAKRYNY